MADRNGTIKRLHDSLKVMNRWCRTDSLDDPISNIERAIEDALELLKGQEPRVLTYDELMALPHGIETDVPVVMETKTPVGKWDGGSMCQWKPAGFVQEMVQDHRWYNREHYGEFWRVWNVRPTVAQREAVKWDG